MRIYILEDDDFLRTYMHRFLELKKYTVESFSNAESFMKNVLPNENDCLIIDINLPGQSGFEAVKRINEFKYTGIIIFISAMKDIENMTTAFNIGAHDYIKKPFALEELELRILNHKQKNLQSKQIYDVCPGCTYDVDNSILLKDGKIVSLSSLQKRLLEVFIQHNGKLLTYEFLIDVVWDNKPIVNSTISSHVKTLKKILECLEIQNIRGEGYIFTTKDT